MTPPSTLCDITRLICAASPRLHLLAVEFEIFKYTGLLFARHIAHGVLVGLFQKAQRTSLHVASAAFKRFITETHLIFAFCVALRSPSVFGSRLSVTSVSSLITGSITLVFWL